ncbi:MAG: hypothetical protein KY460_15395 [Actinobacteria bacterium]|nr:hypothetical protein [Actinomycetota bacterium]
MAGREMQDLDRRSSASPRLPSRHDAEPWLFPFDRTRHERARGLLGVDTAADHIRPSVTADLIDDATREYERACGPDGQQPSPETATWPSALHALQRLADVEERHVALLCGESGHDTLALAELAVAHRRQLARCDGARHRPLLGLSLVLLTHELHASGRFADAIGTGQEAIDILGREPAVGVDRDVRPALVLALDASVVTCLANGRRVDALEDLIRATDLLDDLAHERAAFAPDLDHHLWTLSNAVSSLGLDSGRATAAPGAETSDDRSPADATVVRTATTSTTRTFADELYDDALHLVASDGDGPAAAAAIGASVNAYRGMLGAVPAHRWHRALRCLARSLWRHAVILNEMLDRPRDAMGPGRESLTLARDILRATERADGLDDVIAELGVTWYDLSHIALAAGLIGEHDQLAEEATRITVHSVGHRAMRALGAALHSRAAEACETTAALATRGRSMRATVSAGLHTSGRAVTIRRDVLDDRDDATRRWELANSLLAHGHLLCLDGAAQRGAQAMAEAYATVRPLPGRQAQAMREAARGALLAARAAHPGIVAAEHWPR